MSSGELGPVENDTNVQVEVTEVVSDDAGPSENIVEVVEDEPVENDEGQVVDVLETTLKTRNEIDVLIEAVRARQRQCRLLENENSHLQEYVGSMMRSGALEK